MKNNLKLNEFELKKLIKKTINEFDTTVPKDMDFSDYEEDDDDDSYEEDEEDDSYEEDEEDDSYEEDEEDGGGEDEEDWGGDSTDIFAMRILDIANKQLGKPYFWGDEGPSKFDCSGLVHYAARIPRDTANGYFNDKDYYKPKSVSPGDLIFFGSNGASHVGIVEKVENGKATRMIHASGGQKCPGYVTGNGQKCVVKSQPITRTDFLGYRRIY
jgi:hypothetical protein